MKRIPPVGQFIDVANWRASVFEAFGPEARIDFERLQGFAASLGTPVVAQAFCVSQGAGGGYGFFHYLRGLGYHVDITPLKTLPDGTRKGNVDPLLSFCISEALSQHGLRSVILGTGDIDFLPVVEILTHRGIEVVVIGPSPRHTASELMFAATRFYTLSDLGLIEAPARPERQLPGDVRDEQGFGMAGPMERPIPLASYNGLAAATGHSG